MKRTLRSHSTSKKACSQLGTTMTFGKASLVLVSILCNSPVPCYTIEPGMVAGIVSADVVLTLFLVFLTYFCTISMHQKKHRREHGDKVYVNFFRHKT
uniref:hematopoietic cell signal transducer isoform X2 n=1 Tax=Doryrhamphus excisus TaxID=161450 RepID=UPI0025AE956E|nr:hematopoietic cell signal transducer isoform X2 [Doryrhamphus excisus]